MEMGDNSSAGYWISVREKVEVNRVIIRDYSALRIGNRSVVVAMP